MMKTTKSKYPIMSHERIVELQNFKTKDFTDCPVQTPEQLQEFKPKYPESSAETQKGRGSFPDARLYKHIKKTVQIRLDADVLEWLKQLAPEIKPEPTQFCDRLCYSQVRSIAVPRIPTAYLEKTAC